MRRIRQWMSDNSEIAGILIFLLIVTVIGTGAYGISRLTGGSVKNGGGQAAESGEDAGSTDQTGLSAEPSDAGESQAADPSAGASDAEESSGAAQSGTPTETTAGSGTVLNVGDTINEYGVYFQIVDEQVTAKIETNLRRVPSTENDEDVVVRIYNGEWIRRTGIGHNGWSRVEYEGQVLYAVTSYLSTDGTSSSVPTYQEVNESVTAKLEVYLRTEPDSSSEDNIVTLLPNGTYVTRVGIGSNGWSKLDYNGTTVYAVTSLLTTE